MAGLSKKEEAASGIVMRLVRNDVRLLTRLEREIRVRWQLKPSDPVTYFDVISFIKGAGPPKWKGKQPVKARAQKLHAG